MATHQSVGEIKERGYTVLEGALDADTLARFQAELQPFLDDGPFGRNDFEGHRSKRVYAMLAKTPTVAALVEHPDVLAIVDEFLMPNYLLTSCLAIDQHPGETRQSFHFDDGGINQPRPRKPAGISTIWAIDDFTEENGATEVIPGSHLWGDETPDPDSAEFVKVTMSAGSVVVFAGTLWHRGGSNDSDANRLGITPQYCEPWARQLENMVLAVGPKARDYSDRIKSMLGYSITPPFMGYVDGRHPMKCLDEDFDPVSTGDGDRSRVFRDDEYRFRTADATEGV